MIRFDHVNIRVTDQQAVRDFLAAVVGLKEGPRPAFSFPGYWLYLGDQPVVHLAPRDVPLDGGWVNHVAFAGFDLAAKTAELKSAGLDFKVQKLHGTAIPQIFVDGPEGVRVELQCAPAPGVRSDPFAHHFPIDQFTLEVNYDPGPYTERFEFGCTATINGDESFRIPGVVNVSRQTPLPLENTIDYGRDDKHKEVATVSLWVSDRDFEMFRAIAIQRSENQTRPTELDFVVKTAAAFVRGEFANRPLTHSAFYVGYNLRGAP